MSNYRKAVELRQDRYRKVVLAREIYDNAKDENRELTASEQTRFDSLMDEADRLDRKATLIEEESDAFKRQLLADMNMASLAGDPEAGVLTRDQSYGAYLERQGWPTDLDAEIAAAIKTDRSTFQIFRALFTGEPRNDLERRALSAGSNAAGGFTVPAFVRGQIIDFARSRSVAIRAGARTIAMEAGTVHYPKIASEPTFTWYGENATSTSVDPTFTRETATAKTLRGVIRGSRELFQDSAADMESAIVRMMGARMAQQLDASAVVGGQAGGPTGLMQLGSTDGIGVVINRGSTTGVPVGGILNWSPLVAAVETIAAANLDTGREGAAGMAAVMSPRSYGSFGHLRATDNQPMQKPAAIENLAMLQTSAVPNTLSTAGTGSEVVVGDYSHLALAMRLDPTFQVLSERYASEYQTGILASLRADTIRDHNEAFCRVTLVGASTYYP